MFSEMSSLPLHSCADGFPSILPLCSIVHVTVVFGVVNVKSLTCQDFNMHNIDFLKLWLSLESCTSSCWWFYILIWCSTSPTFNSDFITALDYSLQPLQRAHTWPCALLPFLCRRCDFAVTYQEFFQVPLPHALSFVSHFFQAFNASNTIVPINISTSQEHANVFNSSCQNFLIESSFHSLHQHCPAQGCKLFIAFSWCRPVPCFDCPRTQLSLWPCGPQRLNHHLKNFEPHPPIVLKKKWLLKTHCTPTIFMKILTFTCFSLFGICSKSTHTQDSCI